MDSVLFLQGAALGLTAAFSPGTFQTYLISQALTGGFRRAAPVALAPLVSDLPIILSVTLLLDRLPDGFLRWIGLCGGLLAFYLAWGLWREWQRRAERSKTRPDLVANDKQTSRIFLKGILMNLLSPGPYIFWTLVCGPILVNALHQSAFSGAAFLVGFYSLFIGGMLGIVALFAQAVRLGPRLVQALTLVSIIVLAGFGVLLIWQAASV